MNAKTLALIILFIASLPVSAHGGGLDGYGCRHNRKESVNTHCRSEPSHTCGILCLRIVAKVQRPEQTDERNTVGL